MRLRINSSEAGIRPLYVALITIIVLKLFDCFIFPKIPPSPLQKARMTKKKKKLEGELTCSIRDQLE